MKKKQRFLVYTQYVFDGVFDVVAESKDEARQKVLKIAWLLFFSFERVSDQRKRKEAKESRKLLKV